MKKRMLGNGLEVSEIGYGCMGLSHAYGVALEKDLAIKRIHEALDAGYTFFDTAEVYTGEYADGSISVNEEIVGEALHSVRNQVVIASKCGIYWSGDHRIKPDARPEAMRKSLEKSLKRLRVDTIDLYYQHRPDPDVEPEVVARTMRQFIKEGKIRFWGISNGPEDYVRRANAECGVTAVQLRYSMMARWNEKMFPMLEELNIGLVAFSPLANGFLSAGHGGKEIYDKKLDYRSWMPQYSKEGREKAKDLLGLIERLARQKDATPSRIVLAWVLHKKPWIVPIPGTTKSWRIVENARTSQLTLTSGEMREIDEPLSHMDFEVFGEQEKADLGL